MVPDLEALGSLHFGNVYEDDSLEGMAARVLGEAPERFVLVGFSMGGFVARVLTLMAPERVTGVAFVASSARGYSDEERARRESGYRPGDRPPRAAGAVSNAMGLHPDRDTDPVLLDRLRGMQRRLGPEVRKRQAALVRPRRLRRPRTHCLPVPGRGLPPGPPAHLRRNRTHGAGAAELELQHPRRLRPHGPAGKAARAVGAAGCVDQSGAGEPRRPPEQERGCGRRTSFRRTPSKRKEVLRLRLCGARSGATGWRWLATPPRQDARRRRRSAPPRRPRPPATRSTNDTMRARLGLAAVVDDVHPLAPPRARCRCRRGRGTRSRGRPVW